jgi:hypothetical protein
MIHLAIVAGTVGVMLFRCAGPKWDGVDPLQILRKRALPPRFGVASDACQRV